MTTISKDYSYYLQLNNDSLTVLFEASTSKDEQKLVASIILDRGYHSNKVETLVNGFEMLYELSVSESTSLQYVDSLLKYNSIQPQENYPETAYYFKGLTHYNSGKYELAMEFYSKAYELSLGKSNPYMILRSNHAIAILKNTIDRYDEATATFENNLDYIESNQLQLIQTTFYLATMYALGNGYNMKEEFLKANNIIEKGISFSKKIGEIEYQYHFELLHGATLALQGEYQQSIKKVKRAINNSEMNSQTYAAAINILSYCYLELEEEIKALEYLHELDSIHIHHPEALLQVAEGNEIYSDYYSKINNIEKELYHLKVQEEINKELQIDKIKLGERIGALEAFSKQFNVSSNESRIKRRNIKFGVGIIVILLAYLITLWKAKLSTYTNIIETSSYLPPSEKEMEAKNVPVNISESKINQILNSLDAFEKEGNYLNPNLTLAKLAKEFDTNSTYLSLVINRNKNVNFSTYLANLRIAYITDKLDNSNQLRNYTIEAISKECGFSNSSTFARAFVKRTGKKPSEYLASLVELNNY